MGASLSIAIETGAPQVAAFLRELARVQLPFATAVALTRTARDDVIEGRRQLHRRFKIRSPRMARGVTFTRAEKRDWPNCRAVVGDRDEFMLPHETGGEKKANKGADNVAVPLSIVVRRRSATGAIPKRLKPKQLLSARRGQGPASPGLAYKVPNEGIFARQAVDDRPLEHYFLRRRVKIRERFGFRRAVKDESIKRLPIHFERELWAAINSARVHNVKLQSEQARALYLKALSKLA